MSLEKQWVLYILECGDGSLSTGITDRLPQRLAAHRCGKGAKYTRGRGPLKLRYLESVPDKSTALKREHALKQLRRSEKMAIIQEKEREIKSLLEIGREASYTNGEIMREDEPAEEE